MDVKSLLTDWQCETAFVAGSAGGQQAVATGSTSGVLPAVPAIRCGGPAGRYKWEVTRNKPSNAYY